MSNSGSLTLSRAIVSSVLLASLAVLTGCLDSSGSSDDSNGSESGSAESADFAAELSAGDIAQVRVDASSHESLTGVNLLTGETTTDLSEGEWHIALQRYNVVMLNGGLQGEGEVTAALAHAQDDFYDSEGEPHEDVFVNATPDMYEADLDYPYDLQELDFSSESFEPAFGEWRDWATYRSDLPAGRPGGGYVTANEDHFWVVRSTEGSFYAVQLLDNDEPLFDTRDSDASFDDAGITISVTAMDGDGHFDLSSATELSAELDDPRGSIFFDLDSASFSTDESADWDIRYTVETTSSGMGTGSVGVLRLNGGVTGDGNAALHNDAPFSESDMDSLDGSAQGFSFSFSSDSVDNVFTANEWFRYGVGGGHRLSPNFRVFAIDIDGDTDTEDDIVLLQAVNYYHPESGESGHITLRARLLAQP